MINKVSENIWQLEFERFGSCVYILKLEGKIIIIDTGALWNRSELKDDFKELEINLEDVEIVILTHNHFDHIGNVSVFKNAKVYGGKDDFSKKDVLNIDELVIKEFKIIKTPGHSRGSFCIYMPKKKILFSGDTLFEVGVGRTDLPGSEPDKIKESLDILYKLDVDILCPGHV